MKTVLDIGVLIVTLLMMVTVGTELETQHFRELARRKWTWTRVFVLQATLLPAIGFALVRWLGLPPHVSAGILLLAACPVGDIANVYTLLARGNVAMSVSMNTLSCLLSLVTMPLIFGAYTRFLNEPFVFAVPPSTLILRLSLMVAVPVVAGMALRRFKPGWVASHGDMLRRLTFSGIGVLLLYVMVSRRAQLAAEWRTTTVAASALMALAMGAGLTVGRFLRLSAADIFTTGVVFAVRNVGLAFAVAVTLLNRLDYAVFAAIYFLVEIPLLLGAATAYSFMSNRVRESRSFEGA